MICPRTLKSPAIEISSYSNLVSKRGGIDSHLQFSKINQASLSHSLNLLPKPSGRDNHTQIQSWNQRQAF